MNRSDGTLKFDESTALQWCAYEQRKGAAYTSMYTYWSGIKSILETQEKVGASQWLRVRKWLKNYYKKHKHEKTSAPTFNEDQVREFLDTADDSPSAFERHLLALPLGLYGRLRAEDYARIYHDKCDEKGKEERIRICKSYELIHVLSNLCVCKTDE